MRDGRGKVEVPDRSGPGRRRDGVARPQRKRDEGTTDGPLAGATPGRTGADGGPLSTAFVVLESVVFVALFLWLMASAALVDIEYYDGFDAIRNARWFLGAGEDYIPTRGPLLGSLLVPAEALRAALGLDPLDVRPHHALFALLHAVYLAACYRLAAGPSGRGPAALLAFAAAILSWGFFAYAPFLGHDILPGLLFVLLLREARTFMDTGRRHRLGLLVLLGAAAALVKSTYALFWGVALLVEAAPLLSGVRARGRGVRLRRWVWLLGAAALSAFFVIGVLGLVLREVFPDTPWVFRALRQGSFLLEESATPTVQQPIWVYLRNLPAYGLPTLLLLPLGLVLSWRRGGAGRGLAVAWIASVVVFHLLPLRQVRYLLVLAPITLLLVLPAARFVLARRPLALATLALVVTNFLPIHPYAVLSEAGRIASPFYRRSEARAFLAPLAPSEGSRDTIYHNWGLLSFVRPGGSPLAGDVYHGIFHLGADQLSDLGVAGDAAWVPLRPAELAVLAEWSARVAFVGTMRGPQVNPVRWSGGLPADLPAQRQRVFLAREFGLRVGAGGVVTELGAAVELLPGTTDRGEPLTTIVSEALRIPLDPDLPIRAHLGPGERPYLVRALAPGRWVLPAAVNVPAPGARSEPRAGADSGADSRSDPRAEPFLRLACFELVREHRYGE